MMVEIPANACYGYCLIDARNGWKVEAMKREWQGSYFGIGSEREAKDVMDSLDHFPVQFLSIGMLDWL